MKIATVDIDGTLCDEGEQLSVSGNDKKDYEMFLSKIPKRDAIEKVNMAIKNGHKIIIWTHRASKWRKVTERWLKKECVGYHELVMDKIFATSYVDNRGCTVKDWIID